MNTNNIKRYAPKARKAFIEAMSKQAAKYGITANAIAPVDIKGDLLLIDGRAFPVAIQKPRLALVQLIEQQGYAQTMEKVAYSWFNRLCAIRYMELHDYLRHGRRVLSHPEHPTGYQLLDDCLDIDLPGLDKALVRELKLDGTKDEALYRELLLAQCHALHEAMPFLFESVDDATELLLPENLTKTDSLIHDLVTEIPEDDWSNIEIIGWLYQFYISEKKDQVIGKVVKSEDIPAATQLFTPNWIVKYMVQNSLGAQWIATYPQSPLKGQMEYYIESAEQADEVKAQLAAITPHQLNPEELSLIDPACGSGHILVEAYELFKAIYQERGYRQRDIPQLILEKNLFGLDIDERAAQLTGFALMMKGRADDRRLFECSIKLNVMALVDSEGFDPNAVAQEMELSNYGLKPSDLTELKRLFEQATTFGSLIQVPQELANNISALKKLAQAECHDLFALDALKCMEILVQQADILAAQYDIVVANPPYMGSKYYCAALKDFVTASFKAGKADLYGAFTLRNIQSAKENGRIGMITIPSWMFLSSFESLRNEIVNCAPIDSLVHNGRGVWGSDFGSCAYILRRTFIPKLCGRFLRLFDKQGSVVDNNELVRRFFVNPRYSVSNVDFSRVPGSPIAYWMSNEARKAFECPRVGSVLDVRAGLTTGDTERFLRYWQEVSFSAIGERDSKSKRYIAYDKGGDFRKWYGNREYVLKYSEQSLADMKTLAGHRPDGLGQFFEESITWSKITAGRFSCRFSPNDAGFDATASSAFGPANHLHTIIQLLNSNLGNYLLNMINSSIVYLPRDISNFPLCSVNEGSAAFIALQSIAKSDWDAYERSWDFTSFPLLNVATDTNSSLESSYMAWITQNRNSINEIKNLEEDNNRLFIDAYGLQDELTPDVPIEQITLTVNPAYRYGGNLTEEEQWTRFREDTIQDLVSYAIGCMMGRYSLDEPGLIYANRGNEDFDASSYSTFTADDDGIVPLTSMEWFEDDAANRVEEFISFAWDKQSLEENLQFLASNLSPKRGEGGRDTIRRYLSDKFFKDHLKTYKKRPIYWLFSSGKEKTFQCLVYLHRYNEGTLSRMRTEYVIPLTAKLSTYVEKLERDKDASSSTTEIKKLEKEIAQLHKQQAELSEFDERLRHYADQKISLDLDDGVKVNYGKFGNLLAEVKAVTGKAPEVL